MERWHPDFFDRFEALTVFDLLTQYLKTGRIRLDKSKMTVRATYHDPCNYGRKAEELFGHGYYDEPRWIMDQCFSEWVDLSPSRGNQYCCGGGGGTLLTPFKAERIAYGRKKIEQVKQTKAEWLVVPCHSCHGQIRAMAKEHGLPDLQVKYLWEVVAEALVVG